MPSISVCVDLQKKVAAKKRKSGTCHQRNKHSFNKQGEHMNSLFFFLQIYFSGCAFQRNLCTYCFE